MGIILIPPQKYKCSECGGVGHSYVRSAKPERPGSYKGIKCVNCGHESGEIYQPTIEELEMGSGQSWTHNPNKPLPF